eukprot:scaffold1130_cov195-Pinguiococcus_pyrenoidosus.AAC.74
MVHINSNKIILLGEFYNVGLPQDGLAANHVPRIGNEEPRASVVLFIPPSAAAGNPLFSCIRRHFSSCHRTREKRRSCRMLSYSQGAVLLPILLLYCNLKLCQSFADGWNPSSSPTAANFNNDPSLIFDVLLRDARSLDPVERRAKLERDFILVPKELTELVEKDPAKASKLAEAALERLQAEYPHAAWKDSFENSLLCLLGMAAFKSDDLRKGVEYYNRALAGFRKAGSLEGQRAALNNLADAHDRLGELERALEYYTQSLELGKKTAGRRGEASALQSMGNVHLKLGNLEEAAVCFNKSCERYREMRQAETRPAVLQDWVRKESELLATLAVLQDRLKKHVEGKRPFDPQRTARDLDQTGHEVNKHSSRNQRNMVMLSLLENDPEIASISAKCSQMSAGEIANSTADTAKVFERFLLHSRPLRGVPASRLQEEATEEEDIDSLVHAIAVDFIVKHYVRAFLLGRGCLDRVEREPERYDQMPQLKMMLLSNVGGVANLLPKKDPLYAIDLLEQALALSREQHKPAIEATSLFNLGNAWQEAGDLDKACACLEDSLAIEQKLRRGRVPPSSWTSLAQLYQDTGKPKLAAEYFDKGLQAFSRILSAPDRLRPMPKLKEEAELLQKFGDVAKYLENPRKEVDHMLRHFRVLEELGRREEDVGERKEYLKQQIKKLLLLSDAFRELGDHESEAKCHQKRWQIAKELNPPSTTKR